jgi:hypothetical protein
MSYSTHPQKSTTRPKPRRDHLLARIYAVRGAASRVAEACGVSRQAVSSWERVPARHAVKVAVMFGLTLIARLPIN